MLTYTGSHITKDFGAPTIRDMAVQGMRICRFAGAYEKYFWPIGMHSLLVGKIVVEKFNRPDLYVHALLHDVASEVVMSDIPKPHKTAEQKEYERQITYRTYAYLGLDLPIVKDERIVKEADILAVHAEGSGGCGPRGYVQTQTKYFSDSFTDSALKSFVEHSFFDYEELLNPDGYWPIRFERTLRDALRDKQDIQSIIA